MSRINTTKFLRLASMLLILLGVLSGCGRVPGLVNRNGSKICTMVFYYGLGIKVKSRVAEANMTGLKIEIKDGNWVEIFEYGSPDLFFDEDGSAYVGSAGERPGTYSVSVTHPSLNAGPNKIVTVTSDGCHVNHEKLEFELK